MNIIVIISDTLRCDHLGCYGNDWIRTPHLDGFAGKAVTFDRCYANSFPTIPARADLFTGKYTYTFMGWEPLPPKETTLAQLLTEQGYSTMAVVDTPFLIKEAYNYDRGFKDFIYIRGQAHKIAEGRDVRPYRVHETDYAAPATMFAAERWLQRHYKEKFFLYVDTWDPHEPWDPPNWYTELYYPNYDGRYAPPCYGKYEERDVSEEDLKVAHACYCGEVTMVDRWTGRLLDTVEALNLMDDTAVIFTADHGFYFGEHGYFGKAVHTRQHLGKTVDEQSWFRSPLYEEVSHIPLLIYVPGLKSRRANALVSLADLMPTVLDLTGLKIPSFIHAQSILPILKEEDNEGKDFAVTSWPLYNPGEATRAVDAMERGVKEPLTSTITTREWTLIYASHGYASELYNLQKDPKQMKNVIQDNPKMAKELHGRFISQLEETGVDKRLLDPRRRLK